MKRVLCLTLAMLLLCGCGVLRENTYIAVEPHDEDYEVSLDSEAVTVSSYLALKNAILYFVEEGVENGVIRTEVYSGNITEDLEQAVYEVSRLTPLGAFAVESMTYDYSRIVSYYEIHIHTSFNRTVEDMENVAYAADLEVVREAVREAMYQYAPELLLRVGDYETFDVTEEVNQIYLEHPEFVLEKPEVTMQTYPESGAQRILEIKFSYKSDVSEFPEKREEIADQVELLSAIYGGTNNDMTNARRLYNRVGRDAVLLPELEDISLLTGSVYGVLVENCSTCYGFAQTFRLLLRACDIECQLISGVKDGASHYWCLVNLDGAYYYTDPSMSCSEDRDYYFLMGDDELDAYGYYTWMNAELPEVELPEYLKPVAFMYSE